MEDLPWYRARLRMVRVAGMLPDSIAERIKIVKGRFTWLAQPISHDSQPSGGGRTSACSARTLSASPSRAR